MDGEGITLGRTPRFHGQHIAVPRHGVAVHVNAFNFPAWGLAEKAAVALLAGMPVVSKPATSTALVAHRIMEILVEKAVLPRRRALAPRGLGAATCSTTSGPRTWWPSRAPSDTGAQIRQMPSVIRHSVRVNVEADSLNAAVLGPDVEPGRETWDLFLKDVLRDMTQKAGQKCTAIRRVLVPAAVADRVRDDLVDRLSAIVVGNPAHGGRAHGPARHGRPARRRPRGHRPARAGRPTGVRPGRGRGRWAPRRARASSSRRC